jgi:3-deoxy-7-phosphoheptulonate synthase
MREQKQKHNVPIISELTNIDYLDAFLESVDIIQIGARSMQNFEMLKELGQTQKPVLLKRGFSNTIDELLMSAEYIVNGGNQNVILCERGIRTFETRTRNTLDISAVPLLKQLSPLPVVVDPSHAAGRVDLIESLTLASIAAGADGLMIEVHNEPAKALSDGAQSLTLDAFDEIMKKAKVVAKAMGRKL